MEKQFNARAVCVYVLVMVSIASREKKSLPLSAEWQRHHVEKKSLISEDVLCLPFLLNRFSTLHDIAFEKYEK